MPITTLTVDSAEAPALSWNVLATAKDGRQRELARCLTRLGDFRWSHFPGLLLGRVEDQEAFFTQLMRCAEAQPGFLSPVARIIPITRTVRFTTENLLYQLKEEVLGWASRIESRTFHVVCQRRGHAGSIHGQDLQHALDDTLIQYLRASGLQPRLEFSDPDVVIAVELIDDVCGLGLIPKALRVRFPFVRIS